ncbi:hypothetical protein AUP68_11420 [Ilyonectria robusta]
MNFQGIKPVTLDLAHYEDDVFARPNVEREDDLKACMFPTHSQITSYSLACLAWQCPAGSGTQGTLVVRVKGARLKSVKSVEEGDRIVQSIPALCLIDKATARPNRSNESDLKLTRTGHPSVNTARAELINTRQTPLVLSSVIFFSLPAPNRLLP